jgi:hypothetical protein
MEKCLGFSPTLGIGQHASRVGRRLEQIGAGSLQQDLPAECGPAPIEESRFAPRDAVGTGSWMHRSAGATRIDERLVAPLICRDFDPEIRVSGGAIRPDRNSRSK